MINRLLLIHPHLNIRGGSERLAKILIDELTQYGIEVHVLTGYLDSEWVKCEKGLHLIGKLRNREEIEDYVSRVVSDIRPDAALIAIQEAFYSYAVKKALASVATGMYIHFPIDEEIDDENVEQYSKFFRYPQLNAKYLSYVDIFMANSKRTSLASKLLWGVEPHVVYPCIDSIFFKYKPILGDKRENLILNVGRFCGLKRQDFLVLAFKQITEKVRDARLVLTGYVDPRHREYFEHVKELTETTSDVELIPSPSERKLLSLYSEAKVFVNPRIGEHFGLAPLEAMSQGAPAVVRGQCGLSEILRNGIDGYVACSDYEFISHTIHVLKMPHEKWAKLQKEAYKKAQSFKPSLFSRRVLGLLDSTISG